MIKRLSLVLCLAVTATLPVGCGDGGQNGAGRSPSMPAIHVRHRRLVDDLGREWQLRGINARIEGWFDVTFDDGRTRLEPLADFTADDARLIVQFGFNFLRLPINWSGLEPHEGEFSDSYLANLDRVIGLCKDAGFYVLVDFHQDAYSKEIGEDGAPLWAIVPPPEMLLEGPLNDLDQRRLSTQVSLAFRSFFDNRDRLQDRFLPAWRLITGRYTGESAIVGFEVMNEPVAYYNDDAEAQLLAFYRKAATAMREVNPDQPLWLEPDVSRNISLIAPLLPEPFPDDQVVYCPHTYPLVSASTVEGWKNALRNSFLAMRNEADSWGAALHMNEWGANPVSPGSDAYIQAVQELSEEVHAGQAFWLWKENSQGFWGFFNYDAPSGQWNERPGAARTVGKPYAMAVPGEWLEHGFDVATGTLRARFHAAGGEAAPLLFLPSSWYPQGVRVTLNGAAVPVAIDPETHRAEIPWQGKAGDFEVVAVPAE